MDTSFKPAHNFAGSFWHIHKNPIDFTEDPDTRCTASTFEHKAVVDPSNRKDAAGREYSTLCSPTTPLNCQAGDLSRKFGYLQPGNLTFIDSDPELQLIGLHSVIGRSLVIHGTYKYGYRACGNIYLDDDNPDLYVAIFNGPKVGGSIHFRQSRIQPSAGVLIDVNLYHTDLHNRNTMKHPWGIYNAAPSVSYVITSYCLLQAYIVCSMCVEVYKHIYIIIPLTGKSLLV